MASRNSCSPCYSVLPPPTFFSLVAILLLLLPDAVLAQESNSDPSFQYQLQKKNEVLGFALEAFIPLGGHLYAGDVRAGFVPAIVSVGGVVGMFVGANLESGCDTSFGVEVCDSYSNDAVILLGTLIYLGGRAWGVLSAIETVEQFNQALQTRLGISLDGAAPILRSSPHGVTVGISVQLGK